MQIHLFLSYTVLLLSVYGVRCKNLCKDLQEKEAECYLNLMRFLTRGVQGIASNDYIRSICRTEYKNFFKDCDGQYFSPISVKVCSKNFPNVKQNLEIMRNSFAEAIKFICRDDAKHIIEFYRNPALCIHNTYKATKKCEKDYPLFTIIGNYSESFCSKVDKGLNCIRESVNITDCREIEQKTLNGYYQILKFNTPCKKEN